MLLLFTLWVHHMTLEIYVYFLNIVSVIISVITQQVLGMLPVQILSGYPYNVEEREPNRCRYPGEIMPFAEPARRKRSRFYYPYYVDKNDVYNIFRVRYTTCPISYFRGPPVSWVSLYTVHLTLSNILYHLLFARQLESKSLPTLTWKHLLFVIIMRRCWWRECE